jgi:hypothetical protein
VVVVVVLLVTSTGTSGNSATLVFILAVPLDTFCSKLSPNLLGTASVCSSSLLAVGSIMAPKGQESNSAAAIDAPPLAVDVAVATDGSASVAKDEPAVSSEGDDSAATQLPSPTGGDAVGSATAVSIVPSTRPASEMDDDSVPQGPQGPPPRNVRPRLDQDRHPPAFPLPAARVTTMWQVSTGNGWWMDCSAPFASALESQFQHQVPVAQFMFYGNTRVGPIEYTHDLFQCQQLNHRTGEQKQIRRLTVTLGS